jgi:hypothetical protein
MQTGNSRSIDTGELIQEELNYPRDVQLPSDIGQRLAGGFDYGTRVRWSSEAGDTEEADSGTVIGKFLSYAPHCRDWEICHLIWLDETSPSREWTKTDIAWVSDLELI